MLLYRRIHTTSLTLVQRCESEQAVITTTAKRCIDIKVFKSDIRAYALLYNVASHFKLI